MHWSFEQTLHLFPPIFGIVLCLLSKFDNIWIDAKISTELNAAQPPPPTSAVTLTQEIANGAAGFAAYIANVLLFIVSILLAIFDWPRCFMLWLVFGFGVLVAILFYFVIVTLYRYPLSVLERLPVQTTGNGASLLSKWKAIRLGNRLVVIQIIFNLIALGLTILGLALGGSDDARGICNG
jgi:hypothetical protein